MKKILSVLLCIGLLMGMTACGSKEVADDKKTTQNETTMNDSENNQNGDGVTETKNVKSNNENKTLVVYFSMPETTDPENMNEDEENSAIVVNGEVLGNTQYAAYLIQEHTGAEIFRIEPKTPYTTDHEELVDIASEEQEDNARPEMKANVENIDQYDTIFIGYPIWWSDFPQIIYTFLDENDLSGKKVIPFSTHGGSGLAGTVGTLKEQEPDADIEENALSISRDDMEGCESEVIDWLKKIGY